MRRRLALCAVAVLFVTACIKYGVPGLPWRIRRARIAACRRQWLVDPGNEQAAREAAKAAGDRAFLSEFLPAVERHRARSAQRV
jgi:hypothetical protein